MEFCSGNNLWEIKEKFDWSTKFSIRHKIYKQGGEHSALTLSTLLILGGFRCCQVTDRPMWSDGQTQK
jgi:hypothetical protein